jgi:hypothetical protein
MTPTSLDKDEDKEAWETRYTAIQKEDEDKAAQVKATKDAKKAAKKIAGPRVKADEHDVGVENGRGGGG